MTYIHKIINLSTGEETIVPYTDVELKEEKKQELIESKRNAELEAKATEKAALLEKLGISEDEAKLLLS